MFHEAEQLFGYGLNAPKGAAKSFQLVLQVFLNPQYKRLFPICFCSFIQTSFFSYYIIFPVHTNHSFLCKMHSLQRKCYIWAFCSSSGIEPMTLVQCTMLLLSTRILRYRVSHFWFRNRFRNQNVKVKSVTFLVSIPVLKLKCHSGPPPSIAKQTIHYLKANVTAIHPIMQLSQKTNELEQMLWNGPKRGNLKCPDSFKRESQDP